MGASPAEVRTLVTLPQAAGGGFAFPTLRGNANLTPETADTWTAGTVISSPFEAPLLSRLRLTIDYYRLKVNHAIGQQSVDIVMRQCVDPAFNPTFDPDSPFCAGFARNQTGAVGNVTETFLNNGRFRTSGIDVQVDWAADVGPGTVNFNTIFNYLIEMKAAELPSDPMREYAGTQGPTIDGLDGSSYRWKLFTTLGYTYKGAYLGLQWRHLPSIRSNVSVLAPTTTVTGVPESYDLFSLQASYAVTKDVTLRFGIDNLFDKAPPYQGINPGAVLPALPGGSFDTNNYDTVGRSFYMGAKFKF
jgi:outer membrane receptor protein involved in Fe transport